MVPQVYTFFLERVRANLHVVLCLSPVGETFRERCRMFPGLVNCTTIDWFIEWPADALYEVAARQLGEEEGVITPQVSTAGLAAETLVADASSSGLRQ
jgi:dynein heavy chain